MNDDTVKLIIDQLVLPSGSHNAQRFAGAVEAEIAKLLGSENSLTPSTPERLPLDIDTQLHSSALARRVVAALRSAT
jgi:hypothetical protein